MKKLILAATALAALATPTLAQDRWDWAGGRPDAADYRLVGPGVRVLYPELRDTRRGRAFVIRNFDRNQDRFLTVFEARAANRAFAQIAGPRRGGFDWDSRDSGYVVADRARGGGEWDRGAMRGYGFRQTARGATMRLDEDVLFATDSAVLRPGAIDKLHTLADYLRSEPGVRVAIDGYTDSRGSDAHNQALSERRADAVRGAFDQMGVTRARFTVVGHGEADPVASNATPQGMRQNRRVEVTLLGQRADRFTRAN
ncbi:OmpA family protein [Sphingomonas bacterium]|uniref:OmpA family protein n=1 Tax=Sphingomonas bacterium TaxID=1895847 RepID=UPI0026328895|nr:OmpA family protein [Sphingomonas bacterium]MDB5678479.1 OmpA family protein [Sphingomonas bacterium]